MVDADIQDSNVSYAGAVAGYMVNACVENITVDSLSMTVLRYGTTRFGSVVGYCKNTTFSYISVNNSLIDATFSDTSGYCGGVAGNVSESTINNSYVSGDITVKTSISSTTSKSVYVGGIFGGADS